VLAAVAAWLLLGEALGWSQIVGGLLVIAAIVVAQAPGRAAPEIPPST
jgi:drug/metabolite transporter (DMT)-like permease